MIRRFLTIVALAIATACSGSPTGGTFVPESRAVARTSASSGSLIVRVTLRSPRFRPDYVSVASKGMTVSVVGLQNENKTVALSVNGDGCRSKMMTRFCELEIPGLASCPSRKSCYSATVAIYDAYDAKTHKVPAGANLLSRVANVGFRIGRGATTIPIVLQGIPASVAFVPDASSALVENGGSFVLPKCSGQRQPVSVFGVDADDNYIAGPGAPKVALVSDDPAQLAVSSPKSGRSNAFALVPPSAPQYPHGNHTIHLTATAKPGPSSGGVTRAAKVAITYSGDICGVFDAFAIPTQYAYAYDITTGSDGNLWFVDPVGNNVGRITTRGTITEFPIPQPSALPLGITNGPDGSLWFTERGNSMDFYVIGRITTAGNITERGNSIGPHTFLVGPDKIVTGPDGNLWFTQFSCIGKMEPGGGFTEYPVTANAYPHHIVVGPDKSLWFNEFNSGAIGTITTSGALTEFTDARFPNPEAVVNAAGALWFVTYYHGAGRITTSGTFTTQFPVQSNGSYFERAMIAGPDGALWFQDGLGLSRLTTDGSLTPYPFPGKLAGFSSYAMTTGPDGAIWFGVGSFIARLY